jgi:chromosome segregation ATPase
VKGSGGGMNTVTPRASKNNLLNLLDFELPPAPTPRSVPSITVREMESLKSKYSSEISSLRATLSGREAEVEALKRAVSDSERRVGEAMENSREERSKRECVEKEKEQWERRGREFEDVLRKVKEEVLEAERERAEMMTRIEEAEERARDAETRAADAEARALEAATKVVDTGITSADGHSKADGPLFTAEQVQKQIDEKVHTLSTELHAIYKKKHITKVSGLKKGFEAKTKEKTAELQSRIEELERERDELQLKLDGTLSGVLPAEIAAKLSAAQDGIADAEQRDKEREEQTALIERQKAELAGRDSELQTTREELAALLRDLERERVEKGELVAAVDEMLALQADITTVNPEVGGRVEDFRKSISGVRPPSGLRAPGAGGFGFGGGAGASKIAAPGMTRSLSGGKSRMMSNIERMAGGRAME